MSLRQVYIYSNDTPRSQETEQKLRGLLQAYGATVQANYDADSTELIFCIGGDGAFLHCVQHCRMPLQPIIGINTGHLGFFQDLTPARLSDFLELYEAGRCEIQTIRPVRATVWDNDGSHEVIGVNEVLVRCHDAHLAHFAIVIGETRIQDFIGDGLLVSTPVGSTAYNYSLGGSLVAPELEALQLTPVAPMNTNAYRCFRTSILYPAARVLHMIAEQGTAKGPLLIAGDGISQVFTCVTHIDIAQADEALHILRLPNYDYWAKLKSKLL